MQPGAIDMKKARLNLDVPTDWKEYLEAVQGRAGDPTYISTIRKSIRLLDMVIRHQAKGGKIIFESPNGEKETIKIL